VYVPGTYTSIAILVYVRTYVHVCVLYHVVAAQPAFTLSVHVDVPLLAMLRRPNDQGWEAVSRRGRWVGLGSY
jgi:hypothetical protein